MDETELKKLINIEIENLDRLSKDMSQIFTKFKRDYLLLK